MGSEEDGLGHGCLMLPSSRLQMGLEFQPFLCSPSEIMEKKNGKLGNPGGPVVKTLRFQCRGHI